MAKLLVRSENMSTDQSEFGIVLARFTMDMLIRGGMQAGLPFIVNTLEPSKKARKNIATRRRKATVRKAKKPAKKARRAKGRRSIKRRKVTVRNAVDPSAARKAQTVTTAKKFTSVPRPTRQRRPLTFPDDEPLRVSDLQFN